MFKAGDRIKVIKQHSDHGLKLNQIYIVSEDQGVAYIKQGLGPFINHGAFEGCFELFNGTQKTMKLFDFEELENIINEKENYCVCSLV